ncbi:hypothetical protein DMN91_010772 [Ooceraea biroi]|uniref:U3 small nucleolar RNA-associated protein 25 homolog n=1 Tax=Ooceraea biroi TaxID=2015173 RepID=A0A3L8D8R9_OOCBI|nr:digestive organ expansion factor homolog [Ooceraea biroi]RLU16704.1 hypothetical protein DMN91_010772 [Ooceraea biroi]
MAPKRRSFRGGKRKFDGRNARSQTKPKKGKFDLRKASYIKERDAKNEAIEARRRMIEEEKVHQRLRETDSSEEEELDPEWALLSTFAGFERYLKPIVTSSDSESETTSDTENEEGKKKREKEVEKIKVEKVDERTAIDETCETDGEESSDQSGKEETTIRKGNYDDDLEDAETAQEDAGHLRDPFSLHLRNDMDDRLYRAVSARPQVAENATLLWPVLGNLMCQIPKPVVEANDTSTSVRKLLDDEEKRYADCGKTPSPIGGVDWNKLHVKSQIQNNLVKANNNDARGSVEKDAALTPLQRELFSVINNYQDLYYPERTFSNADQIRFVYCLHVINHVLKTRTKILHHNAKLAKSNRSGMGEVPDEYRDQGFVRPKVLIIVPFKHSCLKIVETFISILIGEDRGGAVINKLRFMEDFTGNELAIPTRNPKPEDYRLTLQGNIDDKFKIGIAVTKKSLKLYTKFYSSDIIIASPLGLRRVIGAEGEAERDYDFLSCIELLIMDQVDVVAMQNWDHLNQVLDHLHLQPKRSHDIEYPRLRGWCVNGWSKYYRQTLIFSSIELPHINATFTRRCFNYAGRVKVANPVEPGSIRQVVIKPAQVFYRFDASDLVQAIDARMEFFLKEVLPRYRDPIMNHTLIYVPCYFDFISLRNRMMKEDLSFVQISEYTKDRKVARARDTFFHSDAHFLLYTERWHFYRRTRIKSIRHLVFYQPPTYPHFYSEMCNMMQREYQNPRAGSDSNMSVSVLYNKFDALALARIVGQNRATKMIMSEEKIHTITC